jgi:hypothetical protein|tara:strand:- start:43 stop:189 length:147 start_codon:yes stop_codon:yes gene_type:complete
MNSQLWVQLLRAHSVMTCKFQVDLNLRLKDQLQVAAREVKDEDYDELL